MVQPVPRTGYVLKATGFKFRYEQIILLFSKNVQTGSGTHPASYSMGTGFLYRECSDGVIVTTFL
jgi:hypothetical protein